MQEKKFLKGTKILNNISSSLKELNLPLNKEILQELEEQMCDVVRKHLNPDSLDKIVKFLESDVGIDYMNKEYLILHDIHKLLSAYTKLIQADDILNKLKKDHEDSPSGHEIN